MYDYYLKINKYTKPDHILYITNYQLYSLLNQFLVQKYNFKQNHICIAAISEIILDRSLTQMTWESIIFESIYFHYINIYV